MNKRFFILALSLASCAHLAKGHKYYEEGNYSAVTAFCKDVIQKDSTDNEAYVLMYRALMAQEKYDSAHIAIEYARRLTPDDLDLKNKESAVLLELGRVQFAGNEYQRALEYYESAWG